MAPRSATPPDTASRVWTALHESVTGQDRRRALHAAPDLGPAKGRAARPGNPQRATARTDQPGLRRLARFEQDPDRPQNQQETGMRSTTATCPGTLEPARSVFDRRFRNPGLPVRQA